MKNTKTTQLNQKLNRGKEAVINTLISLGFKPMEKGCLEGYSNKPGTYCIVSVKDYKYYVGESRMLKQRVSKYFDPKRLTSGSSIKVAEDYKSSNGEGFYLLLREKEDIGDITKSELDDLLRVSENRLYNYIKPILKEFELYNAIVPTSTREEHIEALSQYRSEYKVVMIDKDTLEKKAFVSLSRAGGYIKRTKNKTNTLSSIVSRIRNSAENSKIDSSAYGKYFILFDKDANIDFIMRKQFKTGEDVTKYRNNHNKRNRLTTTEEDLKKVANI